MRYTTPEINMKDISSFTLIELLVVIGILGVIATAVVLVLNPAELLKQARDSTRLSDLATLNSALSFFQVDQYNLPMGASNTVYVSVPDTSPTCVNLGLPALPGGWSYACVPTSTLTKVNGTGWVPLNFTLLSMNSPLSKLPIDPVNATSTGNYYTYTPGGSWELTTLMESSKQKMGGGSDKTSTDGGSYPELYEVGTDLSLLPISRDPSLVGYWKFDEGTGGTAYDASGHGNTGTLTNNPTWQTSASCVKGGCLSFSSSSNTYVSVNSSTTLNPTDISVSAWVYFLINNGGLNSLVVKGGDEHQNFKLAVDYRSGWNRLWWEIGDGIYSHYHTFEPTLNLVTGSWYHIVGVFDGSTKTLRAYLNGNALPSSYTIDSGISNDTTNLYIGRWANSSYLLDGLIDNVRIYNRVLSAAEVQAIYTAGQ
jgi:prepilin-type N-terminal cleavage/methylation domain-containing protein